METSATIKVFFTALNAFQSESDLVKKNAENPFFESKYATYAKLWETIQAIFTRNGLSVCHGSVPFEKGIGVITQITHTSGEWVRTTVNLPLSKFDAQAVGSALSYGRRYNLTGLLGLATEDDDGNAASAPVRPQQNYQQTKRGDL